jgi:hypothetical protein
LGIAGSLIVPAHRGFESGNVDYLTFGLLTNVEGAEWMATTGVRITG